MNKLGLVNSSDFETIVIFQIISNIEINDRSRKWWLFK